MIVLAVLTIALVGIAGAANYMYEKASVKGVGYKNVEMIVSTQEGFAGDKLVEKESGSGNVITEKTEIEAERQLQSDGVPVGLTDTGLTDPFGNAILTGTMCANTMPRDYINFTKEAEFEYMPVSYQTGTYDQKWIEKLCVQNYKIGAVLTEMYTHAEHLQKSTEVKTRNYGQFQWIGEEALEPDQPNQQNQQIVTLFSAPPCCTGVLEANLNSNLIGVAHIGWISRDPNVNVKGRHNEWSRSIEDLTGVFSIEKFIQLWGNSTCGAISVDWLPCV